MLRVAFSPKHLSTGHVAKAVARGGTGITTATHKNAIIAGNSTTANAAFSTIRTASGALFATGQDAAASFGTLPVA